MESTRRQCVHPNRTLSQSNPEPIWEASKRDSGKVALETHVRKGNKCSVHPLHH
jgi:hypothetical protein